MQYPRLRTVAAASAIALGIGVTAPGVAGAAISRPPWLGDIAWNILNIFYLGSAEIATGSAAPVAAFLQGG